MSFRAALAANSLYKISNVAVLFLTTAILSRAMGAEGYGLFSLLILNVALFNMLTSFGSDSGIAYSAAMDAKNIDRVAGLLLVIAGVQIVLLLLAEFFCFAVTGRHLLLTANSQYMWWTGLLLLVSVSLQEKYAALMNGSHLYTQCNRVIFLCNLFALFVFAFFFFVWETKSFSVYLLSYVLSNTILALSLAFLSRKRLRFSFRFRFAKESLSLFVNYSALVFVANLIQFFAYRADLWIVAHYRDEIEVGWYALAVRLAQLLWILPVLFASILFPKVSSENETYNHEELRLLLRMVNTVNIVGGLVLFVFIKPLLGLIFGEQFMRSIKAFQILLPGTILFCNATILAAYFAGTNQLKRNLQGSALCFVSVVALDFLLIPWYGYIGAAIASSIGYSLTAFYFIWQYCRQQKVPFRLLFLLQKEDIKEIRSYGKKNLWRNL